MSLDPSNRGGRIRRGPMAADILRKHFTQISNATLRDKEISRRARGLLSELLSHSDGFDISVSSLVKGGPEGRDAIAVALGELENHGYLRRFREKDEETGRFGPVSYMVTDMPNGFSLNVSLEAEADASGTPLETRGNGKTARHSSDSVYQGLDDHSLESRTHKKTTREKNNHKKNTLGAVAPRDGAAAPEERARGPLTPEMEKQVADLCGRLADLVKANGAKRPKITYAWREAAHALLAGEDAYTFDQVWGGIQWAQEDAFWASRTTTMAKLAKHFDQIIIQARMRNKDTSSVEGKQAQKDRVSRRMAAMTEFMGDFQEKYGREMTDAEQKQLLARLKEDIQ